MFWQLRSKWFGAEFVLLVNWVGSYVHKVSRGPSGVLTVTRYSDTLILYKDGDISKGGSIDYWKPLTSRMVDFYKYGYGDKPEANVVQLVGGTSCK